MSGWVRRGKRWHFVVDGRSMCGRQVDGQPVSDGSRSTTLDCATCRRVLASSRSREMAVADGDLPFETVAELLNRNLERAGSSLRFDRHSARRLAARQGIVIKPGAAVVEVTRLQRVDAISASDLERMMGSVEQALSE